jgi:hypothetical protein
MPATAPTRARVADKYRKLSARLDHSAHGSPEELDKDARSHYEEWKGSRARANSRASKRAESDD